MKKTLLKNALMAMMGVGLMAGSAMASTYQWTDADYWTVTDLSAAQAEFKLEWENPFASYESSFGIYSLIDSPTITYHEIFGYTQEPAVEVPPGQLPNEPTVGSIWFKEVDGTWQVSSTQGGTYLDFGKVFGFYAKIYSSDNYLYTWYTDTSLQNGNTNEHFFIKYDSTNHSTLIYLEDLPTPDGNLDMYLTSSDIKPVPEPATMLLFGTGLAGLAGIARRRKK